MPDFMLEVTRDFSSGTLVPQWSFGTVLAPDSDVVQAVWLLCRKA